MGEIFNILLVNPTINVLLGFLFAFTAVGLPGAFGWSIVALTVTLRLLFNPFYSKQMKMAQEMQELKPLLDDLQKKYKDNKQKLQQEQLKLYQERNINPAAGCVVALVQIPFFIALYQVLLQILDKNTETAVKAINEVVFLDAFKITTLNHWFFGFDLTATPSMFREAGLYYLLIPVITAALQYTQVSLQQGATPKPKKDTKKKKKKNAEPNAEDFQSIMSKQMRFMFPLMIAYFSYILPVGLAIYWNVFSLFSIYQQKNKSWKSLIPSTN